MICSRCTASVACVLLVAALGAAFCESIVAAEPPAAWPAVLMIDDFESGLDKWTNDDAGRLELVDGPKDAGKVLRWTAGDDGIGHILFKHLDRATVDFSQYDLLRFRVKVSGKPLWNLDPKIQQQPRTYGYLAQYSSVDTLEGMDVWIDYVQDLRRWENAWPHTYDAEAQSFSFDVHQLAGAGHAVVELDDIQLVKNTLGVERSYRGVWSREADGAQVTRFAIDVTNRADQPQTVRCEVVARTLKQFTCAVSGQPLMLQPGEQGVLNVAVTCPAKVAASCPAFYGETPLLRFRVEETPGLALVAELPTGTKPRKLTHPVVLCTPQRQAQLRKQWHDPEQRKAMGRWFVSAVNGADTQLAYEPSYPPIGHAGIDRCPADDTKLVKIDVPNLPMNRYQCPKCGAAYSGPFFDAAFEDWVGKHQANAQAIRSSGIAYGITGDRKYAEKAAAILRPYIELYLTMPIAAPQAGSPVFSAASGSTRIHGSYMHERRWLNDLAIGLDFVLEANVLSQDELTQLTEKVLAPSANNMMDHKVGVMNLQGMIASTSLYAGLAAEDPQLVARAMYDSHGILNLAHWGYLPDGNWWENPSYQNVSHGVMFPALTTALHAGIIQFDERWNNVFKAAYRLYGPDGRSPTLGTGGPGNLGYSDNVIHSLAWMLDDPQLAWVAHNRKLSYPYDSGTWARFFDSEPKLAKEDARPIFTDRTLDFPHYGGIAMRADAGKMYCYLAYGRHLVHGHYNKLSINAYGKGGWFVRNVMGGYGDHFREFLEPTSGSSTIMVDGRSQDADTGELLFSKSTPLGELASAREIGAYKDLEHERTCVLLPDSLVVIDRCVSDASHTYDWLHHTDKMTGLEFAEGPADQREIESLGDTACYPVFLPATELTLAGPAALVRYARANKSGAAIAFATLDEDAAQLIRARKGTTLIARKKGGTVRFACVMQPLAVDETPTATIEPVALVDAKTGKAVGLDRAQAYRVSTPAAARLVIVNYTHQPVRTAAAPAVTATKRVTLVETK